MVAVDVQSGNPRWNTESHPYDLFNPPAVWDSKLYSVTKKKGANTVLGIAVLDCTDGKILRVRPITVEGLQVGDRPIFLHEGSAILSDERFHENSTVTLFDLKADRKAWTIDLSDDFLGMYPVVSGDHLIGGIGNLWVINLKDGSIISRYRFSEGTSQSEVYKDSLVFRGGKRTVFAFRIDPLKLLWKATLPTPLASNVVLCGDAVCVQTRGGRLALLEPLSGKLRTLIPLADNRMKLTAGPPFKN